MVIVLEFLRAVRQKAGGNRGQIYRGERIPIKSLLRLWRWLRARQLEVFCELLLVVSVSNRRSG